MATHTHTHETNKRWKNNGNIKALNKCAALIASFVKCLKCTCTIIFFCISMVYDVMTYACDHGVARLEHFTCLFVHFSRKHSHHPWPTIFDLIEEETFNIF